MSLKSWKIMKVMSILCSRYKLQYRIQVFKPATSWSLLPSFASEWFSSSSSLMLHTPPTSLATSPAHKLSDTKQPYPYMLLDYLSVHEQVESVRGRDGGGGLGRPRGRWDIASCWDVVGSGPRPLLQSHCYRRDRHFISGLFWHMYNHMQTRLFSGSKRVIERVYVLYSTTRAQQVRGLARRGVGQHITCAIHYSRALDRLIEL